MARQKHKGKKGEKPKNAESQTRRRGKRWGWPLATATLVAALVAIWWLFASPSIPFGDEQAISSGAALYSANCTSCHGPRAEGEDRYSPMGGTKANGDVLAPALDAFGHAWHHRPEELADMIKRGSPRPGTRMAGWQGRLSDAEIRYLISYMYSLWPSSIQERYLSNPHH